MALTATPYGLRPMKQLGDTPNTGHGIEIPIASGYATDIGYGDIVAINASGVLVKVTATGADGTTNAFPAGVIGVFLGVRYTEPTYKWPTFRQNWVGGTVASDAVATVCHDHNMLFRVQASGSVAQTALGANVSVVQNAVDTASGQSRVTVNASGVGTETFRPFRIIGFVNSTSSTVGDAFTDVIVRFNVGIHSLTTGTGV